ncbi:uncharacterized protein [Nicotiana tomentosiformis]|uniref:uncharacterized protein n=1 Tax=Nicotiana tomentosiformis TaxID=4098 RepID=UPI00388CEAF0
MANSATAKIEGTYKIVLKMTSGKIVTLNDILHVPEIKDEAMDPFKQYKNKVEMQLDKKIKMIRSDRGGEYESPFEEIYLEYGYATNSKAYHFLIHKSGNTDIHINTVIESDNAEFFENIYPYKMECESSSEKFKRPQEEAKESIFDEENPRRSKRQRTATSFGPDFLAFLLENEPQTFKEAMSSSEAQYWKEAVNSEIESILSNHTCELVDLPPGNKPLGSKWIFKRKMKANGTINTYKERLVVKGFR